MDLQTILSWFKRGCKPTEAQFAATFRSFRHKDDAIPMGDVAGLAYTLANKSDKGHTHTLAEISDYDGGDKEVLNAMVANDTAELEAFTKTVGMYYILLADHTLHQYVHDEDTDIDTLIEVDPDGQVVYSAMDADENVHIYIYNVPQLTFQDVTNDQVDKTIYTNNLDSLITKQLPNGVYSVVHINSGIDGNIYGDAYTLTVGDGSMFGRILECRSGWAKTVLLDEVYQWEWNHYSYRGHTHEIADVNGLTAELDDKAPANHTHEQYLTEHQDITGKQDKDNNTDLTTTSKSIVGAINEVWDKITAAVTDLTERLANYVQHIQPITYAELVALRNADNLKPGQRYRIIDFVTTTSQPDTRSAGHRFDIIVRADSTGTLNENASAIQHRFTADELIVPTHYLWSSGNGSDYGIITRVRVPQSLDDIVGRYTNDGEEYISDQMLGNYTELLSADENEMLLNWLYTDETTSTTERETDTYSFVGEITLEQSDDPNYFADSKLNAWRLKYCLDNDITRYLFTDPDKGKGVIYYLEDEFGNTGDFDFKNIQHKRYKVTDNSVNNRLESLDGQYVGFDADMQDLVIPDTSDYIWAFSASMPSYELDEETGELNIDMGQQLDATLNRLPEGTGIDADGGGYAHPVIFCKNNKFVTHQIAMTLDDGTWVYPHRVSDIVLFCNPKYYEGDDVTPARVELENCTDNVFASDCDFITANGVFSRNTFLTVNSNLVFGGSVGRTIFKGDCYCCTFGGYILESTFGGDIVNTTFGGYIWYTTFGGNLSNGHIHGYLYQVTIGESGETWTNLVIDPGVEYLNVTCSKSEDEEGNEISSTDIKNVHIFGGIRGTNNDIMTVKIPYQNSTLLEVKPTSKTEILV